jgi:hypothetical protein
MVDWQLQQAAVLSSFQAAAFSDHLPPHKPLLLRPSPPKNNPDPSSACMGSDQVRSMLWTADGSARRARVTAEGGLRLTYGYAVSGELNLCVGLDAVDGCDTMQKLCGGKQCRFQVQTQAATNAADVRVTCCVSGAVSLGEDWRLQGAVCGGVWLVGWMEEGRDGGLLIADLGC